MNLNPAILFFSIVGAVFSFLIWRSSESRDLYSQQEIIRNEHLSDEDDDPITIPFIVNSSRLFLIISIDYIKCYEPESSRYYRVKRLIFGSNGNTMVKLSIKWNDFPDEMPELGGLNLERAISQLDDTGEFDGKVARSGFSKQDIEIFSTRPRKVDRELKTFFNLIEEAVEQEIEEHQAVEETEVGDG
ncbi:hypothetical protein [Halolamina rubra]|uniref:hypothetical protein n=1 Tax=Halolamina rubra TaxID=1380430 RepID=UPI00067844E1|nr:hypothetical protein [Halolamina rubra]